MRINTPDGRFYEGEVVDGKPHGCGVMTFENQDVYNGEWADGIMCGKGEYRFYDIMKDGFTGSYTGFFKDNKFHGQGVRKYADKTKYIGTWQNGMRTGNGAFWYLDGSYLYGIWKYDKTVRGVLHLSTGDIYDGEFHNGVMEGYGKYHWKEDGSSFDGTFKAGKPYTGARVFADGKLITYKDGVMAGSYTKKAEYGS